MTCCIQWQTKFWGLTKATEIVNGVMVASSLWSLAPFLSDEQKTLTRGGNHKSNHVESVNFSDGIICGEIHVSMKRKVYKSVTVSNMNRRKILTVSTQLKQLQTESLKIF